MIKKSILALIIFAIITGSAYADEPVFNCEEAEDLWNNCGPGQFPGFCWSRDYQWQHGETEGQLVEFFGGEKDCAKWSSIESVLCDYSNSNLPEGWVENVICEKCPCVVVPEFGSDLGFLALIAVAAVIALAFFIIKNKK